MTDRQKQALRTKNKIGEVAYALLQTVPYEKLTMSRIAQAAGVSVGTLYHYFESKEALFLEGYVDFDVMVKEKASEFQFASPMEAIRAIIYAQVQGAFLAGHMMMHSLRIQLATHSQYSINENRHFQQYVKTQVNRAIEQGELHPDCEANEVAAAILRSARGVIYNGAVRGDMENLAELALKDLDILLSFYKTHAKMASSAVDRTWVDEFVNKEKG